MRWHVVKQGRHGRLYWNGERWVMNPKRAVAYGKLAAARVAREQQGEVQRCGCG